jgi:hypothetical protein
MSNFCETNNCNLHNVCREKGSLLRLVYIIGQVVCRCCSPPLSDTTLAELACPLSDVMFCLHSGILNLSLSKHCNLHTFAFTLFRVPLVGFKPSILGFTIEFCTTVILGHNPFMAIPNHSSSPPWCQW